jgi:PHD/YefM family antitoxin component YafN of YafNO toxin-antitoxin module
MVELNPQYVIDDSGERKAVLLNISEYQQLIQRLEDLEDALELEEAIETEHDFTSYKEIRKEID